MSCHYKYKGKTYELSAFDDLLRAMPPAEAAAFMPSVKAVPDAPFVGKTDAWVALALKRVVKLAVDEGYDAVAMINGEQSAARYDLSKQISKLNVQPAAEEGFYDLFAWDMGGKQVMNQRDVAAASVEDYIGKELAKKAVEEVEASGKGVVYEGLDLKVGGSGMVTFYDKIVPSVAKDVVRKLGGAMGDVAIVKTGGYTYTVRQASADRFELLKDGELEKAYRTWDEAMRDADDRNDRDGGRNLTQPGFTITDAMREKAGGGLPMFDMAGERIPLGHRSGWRDATNRLQFAPGQWLYDAIGRFASPLLTKLGMKAMSPQLTRLMREMKLEVQKAQETAAAVAKEAGNFTDDERRMVSDIIEQELDAGVIPPAHAVRLAAAMQQSLRAQTTELVSLGMLSEDAAARWDGKYLPRFYESKLRKTVADAWGDAAKRLLGRTSVMRGIKGKHLKGRGMWETIPADQRAAWESLGWEVRDPDYTEGDAEVQMWRDYTREERDDMGEIRDAGFRFVMGYMQTQRDIALGKMFAGMAADPAQSSRLEKPGWVRVPTTVVEGTGVKRYGKLAGRFVPEETMSHLSQIEEASSAAWQMYRKGLSLWKEGKTALNPVSHVNNIVSNLTMAHLAGVSYHRGDKYVAAIKDFETKAPLLDEANAAGLFLGTMSDAELLDALPKELKELARTADSATVKNARWVYNAMTLFLRKPMGAAYKAEDTFFRYLIYKDARSRGAEPADAVDFAQRYIFTYDDLPRGARFVRDFGIPFFAYTYKAVPALLHSALTHPIRMAGPAALLWTANAAAYAIAVGDEEDEWWERLQKYLNDPEYRERARKQEETEREQLPPWMKGTTSLLSPKAIRLGMDELTKLPVFLDVARFIPGGDIFDISPNNAGGLPLPQPITPSHPLFTTVTAMMANKDLFLGKDIVDLNDDGLEATQKRAAWMWRQMSPAIAAGNTHWMRGMQALAQASGGEVKWIPEGVKEVLPDNFLGIDSTGIGKTGLPTQPGYAAMQTFGIKAAPIDLEKSAAINAGQRKKVIRDIDTELRRLQRLERIGAISSSSYEREREKAIEKKRALREKAAESR